jgi:hypothetical protein
MKINWKSISPEDFERLCSILLEKNGFNNIEWHGQGGGDKGRDIVCTKVIEPLPSVSELQKWLVQCKRYTEKRISKSELHELFASAREHKPQALLLIITDVLNSALKDWINQVKKEFSFQIFIWEENHIQREVAKHRKELSSLLPDINRSEEPIWLYRVKDPGITFICNEFDEIEIRHINADCPKVAKAEIEEFLDFIRRNDVDVDAREDETL